MGSEAFTIGTFELTRHAQRRAQNRGIRAEVIELILEHGDIELHAGEGLHSLQISRKGMKRLANADVPAALREKALGVVLSDPEEIVIETDLCLGPLEEGEAEFRSVSDDQSVCTGYAVAIPETNHLPVEHWLANRLGRRLMSLRSEYPALRVRSIRV